MKHIAIYGSMALIALAAACLLAAPVLSAPFGDGAGRFGPGGMFQLSSNLTPEEMDNMTLGELQEMKKGAMNQSRLCPAGDQNCSQNCRGFNNQTQGRDGHSCKMQGRDGQGCKMQGDGKGCQMVGKNGPNDRMMGRDKSQWGQCQGARLDDGAPRHMFRGVPEALLMEDMNAEELSNMTVGQVRDLIQGKMEELDNMTLSQIEQLRQERMQKRENMTLSDLREENRKRQDMAGILRLANFMPQIQA